MSKKKFIWIGAFVGSTIGGMIPGLWGDDVLSVASVLLSAVGAIAGILAGLKAARSLDV